MSRPCPKCRKTKQKPATEPIPTVDPPKIEIPNRPGSNIRRDIVGKTIRIRLKKD